MYEITLLDGSSLAQGSVVLELAVSRAQRILRQSGRNAVVEVRDMETARLIWRGTHGAEGTYTERFVVDDNSPTRH
jgi:hypothetical protein